MIRMASPKLLRVPAAISSVDRALTWGFVVAVAALLAPVWSNAYFLSGDGPCHLYNARVLLEWANGQNLAFYGDYYELNRLLVPNWFCHALLAGLLTLGSEALAVKLLWTLYIGGYAFGARWLLRGLQPEAGFLAFLLLPLIVTKVMLMGFYNYSFSLAALLWLVGGWLRYRTRVGLGAAAGLLLALLLTYLMHPLGLLLALLSMGTCTLVSAGVSLSRGVDGRATARQLVREIATLSVAAAPALSLFGAYLLQIEGDSTPNSTPATELWRSFSYQELLIGLDMAEAPWYAMFAKLVGATALVALAGRLGQFRRLRPEPADAFLLLSGAMLYLYLTAPEGTAGGSILTVRLQGLPFLFLILWLAGRPWPAWARVGLSVAGLVLAGGLLLVRWPIHRLASLAATDYLSVAPYVEPRSTVLPLSFHHSGQWPGHKNITGMLWLFMHTADYLGAQRPPLIMLGNYEANTATFPLKWRSDRNPYAHLAAGSGGIEGLPPAVNLENYQQHGGQVDYVLLWCARNHFTDKPSTQALRRLLARDYTLTITSPRGYAELYESREHHSRSW